MKSVIFLGGNSGSPQTAEWHAWRQMGIGSSDAIILAAEEGVVKAPSWVKNSRWLWEVKTGRRSGEIPSNAAMQRGTLNEAPARDSFIKRTGIQVSPMFGGNDGHPFIRASFDGIDFNQEVLVEIKVPSFERHSAAKSGVVPEYYLVQMAHQALVLWEHPDCFDGKNANYVSYYPETDDLAIVDQVNTGGFDVPLISCLKPIAQRLLEIEKCFWDSVRNETLPCGTEWVVSVREYLAAEAEINIWKEKAGQAKERLINLLGNKAKEVGGGITMSRVSKNGSIDYPALLKTHLPDFPESELEKFRKSGSETFMIRKYEDPEN